VIVAIDGAASDLSLALANPDGSLLVEDAWSGRQRQSAELLPRLVALVDGSGRRVADISALAVGIGPGSFTGLRVAMALAKGFAFALHRPIVGVASLEAWLAAEPSAPAALARAGAREAYLLARGEAAVRVVDRDELGGLALEGAVAAGELAAAFGLNATVPPRGARAIARRAAERLADDPVGDDLQRLEPIYLRAPRGVTIETEAAVRWL
jgi:tRNA threonylcarbamoyl adenosine modification protein YeaZ